MEAQSVRGMGTALEVDKENERDGHEHEVELTIVPKGKGGFRDVRLDINIVT
jgi:hypothetical protein